MILLHQPRFWISLAFVVFFVLFGRRLWKALAQILDDRSAAIRRELDEASRLRREAEAMLAEAETRRRQATEDAERLLAYATEEARRVADAARADAEAGAARRERMAEDRIAAAEKAAVTEVRTAAAELAGRAAELLLAERMTPEADGAIVDRAIASLPSALTERRAA